LAEDDLDGFVRFTQAAGHKLQIVGDDLLVSHAPLLREAVGNARVALVLLRTRSLRSHTPSERPSDKAQRSSLMKDLMSNEQKRRAKAEAVLVERVAAAE
jgi:enolase